MKTTREQPDPAGPAPAAPVPPATAPPPWARATVALLLRLGLGVSLLNGGLIGYLAARRGGTAYGVAWSTLLGPAAVAGILENDILVPFCQIAIGLALVLGFFTVIATVLAGLLIVSGPIFQFLAILSNSSATLSGNEMVTQVFVSTGSINLLLLVAALLWLTPMEGTSWSLDALIFAHRRRGHEAPAAVAANIAPSTPEPAAVSATRAG
jgi:hypothetical protein